MKALTPDQLRTAYKELKGTSLRVYLVLVYHYNKDYGYAYPTVQTIADEIGLSHTQKNKVYKYINELVEKGFIKVDKSPKKSFNRNNVYYILDRATPIIKEKEIKIMKRKLRTQSFDNRERRTFYSKGYKRTTAVVDDKHDELLDEFIKERDKAFADSILSSLGDYFNRR